VQEISIVFDIVCTHMYTPQLCSFTCFQSHLATRLSTPINFDSQWLVVKSLFYPTTSIARYRVQGLDLHNISHCKFNWLLAETPPKNPIWQQATSAPENALSQIVPHSLLMRISRRPTVMLLVRLVSPVLDTSLMGTSGVWPIQLN
jgi:hypothetical protein